MLIIKLKVNPNVELALKVADADEAVLCKIARNNDIPYEVIPEAEPVPENES